MKIKLISFFKISKKEILILITLFLTQLIPSIWDLLRSHFITLSSAKIDTYAQWSYVDTSLEILQETFIVPLFWWFGKSIKSTNDFLKKVNTAFVMLTITFIAIFTILTPFVSNFISIIGSNAGDEQKTFFIMQLWSKLPQFLLLISYIVLTLKNNYFSILFLLGIKMLLALTLDFTLSNQKLVGVSSYIGIGISTVSAYFVTFISSFILIAHSFGFKKFFKTGLICIDKHMLKVSAFAFLDTFVRNAFYIAIVATMANSINEASTYWIANSIFWTWILLPVTVLGDVNKSITSKNIDYLGNEKRIFFCYQLMTIIVLIFTILIFGLTWKPMVRFMTNNDNVVVEHSYYVFKLMVIFYIFEALGSVASSFLVGKGLTLLIAISSIVVNVIVYIPIYVFYKYSDFNPSLYSISVMFGFSMFAATVFTYGFVFYQLFLKKVDKNVVNNNVEDFNGPDIKVDSEFDAS